MTNKQSNFFDVYAGDRWMDAAMLETSQKVWNEILKLWQTELDAVVVVVNSVTRFGKISPLWRNFWSLLQFFEGLFRIWHNFEEMLWSFLYCRAIFHYCKWPKIEKECSQLVTLVVKQIFSIRVRVGFFQRISKWKRIFNRRENAQKRLHD